MMTKQRSPLQTIRFRSSLRSRRALEKRLDRFPFLARGGALNDAMYFDLQGDQIRFMGTPRGIL
jgi:hypothetical protein